jgi:hypothetical protein
MSPIVLILIIAGGIIGAMCAFAIYAALRVTPKDGGK